MPKFAGSLIAAGLLVLVTAPVSASAMADGFGWDGVPASGGAARLVAAVSTDRFGWDGTPNQADPNQAIPNPTDTPPSTSGFGWD